MGNTRGCGWDRSYRRTVSGDWIGYVFDFAFATLFAALCIPLTALAVMLLLTILRKLPRLASGMVVGSCVVVTMLWGPAELGASMAVAIGLTEGILGAR